MKTYKTSTGKSITAESLDYAKELALLYNMGDIIDNGIEIRKKHVMARFGNMAAWVNYGRIS